MSEWVCVFLGDPQTIVVVPDQTGRPLKHTHTHTYPKSISHPKLEAGKVDAAFGRELAVGTLGRLRRKRLATCAPGLSRRVPSALRNGLPRGPTWTSRWAPKKPLGAHLGVKRNGACEQNHLPVLVNRRLNAKGTSTKAKDPCQEKSQGEHTCGSFSGHGKIRDAPGCSEDTGRMETWLLNENMQFAQV